MTLKEILAQRKRSQQPDAQTITATEVAQESRDNGVQGLLLVPLVAGRDEFSEYF